MDTGLLILEGGKALIQAYFNFMRLSGKTPEEIDALYQIERDQFKHNDPAKLETPE